ncbi:hypothetical protein [Microcoleus sp. B3-D7]|uniref:hypothetical protein n=1 Tax=Microcoleus sp. B3-D7 TaxID=2818659 RepID=UPI002FD1B4D2
MATNKKHIAVYLDSAVEQALVEFCTTHGLESKKGLMYSAAVNKALAQFFEVESTTPNKLPSTTSNTRPSDTPDNWEQRIAEIIESKTEPLLSEIANIKASQASAIEQLRAELGEVAA